MLDLLKYTYLLSTKKVDLILKKLWRRYVYILDHPNWEDLNEARAILYLVGNIYCEKIIPEAIERRLHLLKKPLKIREFLVLVDSKSKKLSTRRKDPLFVDLESIYKSAKSIKNKYVGGSYYLDEQKFIKLYNLYNPKKNLKIGYKGNFKNKK